MLSDEDLRERDVPTRQQWQSWARHLGLKPRRIVRELMIVLPFCPLAERYRNFARVPANDVGLEVKMLDINRYIQIRGRESVRDFYITIAAEGHPPRASLAYVVCNVAHLHGSMVHEQALLGFLHPSD